MPPSWVPKLVIPRDAFDMRCPRGSKLMLYRRCQHEIFALFGDSNRYDGMVEKLVVYQVRHAPHSLRSSVWHALAGRHRTKQDTGDHRVRLTLPCVRTPRIGCLRPQDEDRTQMTEAREKFQRRKDKLTERRTYPPRETTMEYFDGGSSFGLKDVLTVKNQRRVMNFYHT